LVSICGILLILAVVSSVSPLGRFSCLAAVELQAAEKRDRRSNKIVKINLLYNVKIPLFYHPTYIIKTFFVFVT
jgi:hypothetical protein